MPKLKNRFDRFRKITPTVIYPVLIILVVIFSSFNLKKHPTYISFIDMKYQKGNLQISTRMFTNDLEDALRKISKKEVDILNPKNKAQVDSILFNYIQQRLSITLNLKKQKLHYIGYEKEDESIWTYLEIKKVAAPPKKVIVNTKLLYDFLPNEINIVQCEINTIKLTRKVTNPENKVEFQF